jgi:gluconate 2-dehydrogenase gamma chain
MDRREAIRRTAWIMGGIVSAPAIVGVLNGCTAKPDLNWKPEFLSNDEGGIISEVAEIIIPKTNTPGAKDAGVPSFIDLMLKDVYSKEDQDRFKEGLKAFDEDAKKSYDDSFLSMDEEQRKEYVFKKHEEAIAAEKSENKPEKRPFILMMKELTMLGFFTSEVGAKQVLQYDPVPGAYKGCIPVSEAGNGRTWAT